jgi:lipoprotein-releasing system ATP-binding protein
VSGPPILEASGAARVLPGPQPVTLVEGIDLSIGAGEFIAISGPSGSGKSSLLYLLGLLDEPTAGSIRLDGRDTAGLSRRERARLRLERIGFVFQFHFLLPEFSALDNVLIPMRRLGRLPERAMRERAEAILAELGLGQVLNKTPGQLSGGERQRAAIGRALANDPGLILADEPTGNLDSRNGGIVFDIFERLVTREGRTVITVTHDQGLARRTRRQIHLVDGRITPLPPEPSGPPEAAMTVL